MRRSLMGSLLVVVGLVFLTEPTTTFAKAVTHTILIENMKFTPADLTVRVGDSILWINKDLVPHTVTDEGKSFNSNSISPEKKWRLHARKKGIFAYKCLFHPTMKATFVVQ